MPVTWAPYTLLGTRLVLTSRFALVGAAWLSLLNLLAALAALPSRTLRVAALAVVRLTLAAVTSMPNFFAKTAGMPAASPIAARSTVAKLLLLAMRTALSSAMSAPSSSFMTFGTKAAEAGKYFTMSSSVSSWSSCKSSTKILILTLGIFSVATSKGLR